MSIASKFKFIGDVLIPKDENTFVETGSTRAGKEILKIKFKVKENSHNAEYVKLTGYEVDVINTRDVNGENLEIKWEDRFNSEIVRNVASYRKHYVDLGISDDGADNTRKEFITDYDLIDYLAKHLPDIESRVAITGIWKKMWYNGRMFNRFEIGNVYAVSRDVAPTLSLSMDFFYNKDSIDESDFKSDKKIYVNGYISQYDRDLKQNVFYPQTAILSAAQFNLEKDDHKAKWECAKKYIDKTTSKNMYHIKWDCKYVNGAEEVAFDESLLTAAQKEQIELGIKTIDDFKPRNAVYGEKVVEIRLKDPDLNGIFSGGLLTCEETVDEFMDSVFKPMENESIDSMISTKNTEEPKETASTKKEIDDLFNDN